MRTLRIATTTLALTVGISLAACNSVKTGGALKVAKDTLEGEPIISDEEFEDRAPNTSHIPDQQRSGGFLQFEAQ